ncbi:MAG: 30S ribosomal protein S3 [Dehalococcoidia bacterium]
MGQKTHPIGFRLGGVQDWRAHWFASKASDYRRLTEEDQKIRGLINDRYAESGAISRVEIERGAQDLVVTINTARPGIIIGRGGTRVDELRSDLEKLTEKRSRLNIQEIRQPELDATLVGQSIAEQLERRVAYRRAVRLAMQRTMQSGAQGIKIVVAGRLGGAEIARTDKQKEGRTPLHTLRAQIDFAVSEAKTTFGVIGIKVWIYTGDMIPSAENLRARSMARLSLGATPEGQAGLSNQGNQGGGKPSGGGGGGGGRGRSASQRGGSSKTMADSNGSNK